MATPLTEISSQEFAISLWIPALHRPHDDAPWLALEDWYQEFRDEQQVEMVRLARATMRKIHSKKNGPIT
jgi:hypothetical protein